MAKSDELKNLRYRYRECLRNAQNTASALSNSIRTLQTLINTQGSCYKVDDVNGGTNYLTYLLEKENSIYSNIVNNIIPGTQSKISNLDWRISDALQKEALEKAGEA